MPRLPGLMRLLQCCVPRHPVTLFVVLGLAFIGFGVCTLSLAMLVKLTVELVARHGWQALMDGAGWQLLELLALTYGGMACYVMFKLCEYRLVHALDVPGD